MTRRKGEIPTMAIVLSGWLTPPYASTREQLSIDPTHWREWPAE
jgi:hypothetical protein